jgi:hypothetical protein
MPGIRGSQEGCPKIRIGLGFAIGVGEAREVIYTEEVFDGWKSVTRLLRGDGLSVEGRKKSAEVDQSCCKGGSPRGGPDKEDEAVENDANDRVERRQSY